MEIEKHFVENFLSKNKFSYGALIASIMIGICVLFSHLYWHNLFELKSLLAVNQELIFVKGEYWRLFSSALIHADVKHLLSNLLMLFILTYFVSSFYGATIAISLSLLFGGVINFLTIQFYEPHVNLVGASGIVYFLWGFWLVLYLGIQKQMSVIKRILRVGTIFFVLLVPTSYQPQTSYLAHYIGLVLGMFVGSVYFLYRKKYFYSFEQWKIKIIEEDFIEEYNSLNPEDRKIIFH